MSLGAARLGTLKRLLIEKDWPLPEIAQEFGISRRSIKVYCSELYDVEGAGNGRITLIVRENKRLRDLVESLMSQLESKTP